MILLMFLALMFFVGGVILFEAGDSVDGITYFALCLFCICDVQNSDKIKALREEIKVLRESQHYR